MAKFSPDNPDLSTPQYPNDAAILISKPDQLVPWIEHNGPEIEGQLTEKERGGVIVSSDPEVWWDLSVMALELGNDLNDMQWQQIQERRQTEATEAAIHRMEIERDAEIEEER